MSGDVQPRKRKDKRRKKDEVPGQDEPIIQASSTGNEDFNIHVHNDHGTGGGICAKLVFFVLLSVIAVLIGMIIVEKRGLTDLETAPTESRFANIFEGWIDESIGHHEEDHAHKALVDHDEHEEQEASEEASIEHNEHEEGEHVSEEVEEQASEDAEEAEEELEEELEETEEELEETAKELEETDEIGGSEKEEQNTEEVKNDEQSEEQQEEDEEFETLVDERTANEDDDNSEDIQASHEEDEVGDNDDDDNEAADTNEDDQKNDENTAEEDDNSSNQVDDAFYEQIAVDNISEENEFVEENSFENTADDVEGDDQEEEVVDNTAGEEDALKEEFEKQEEIEVEESSSMAVKFGVGVALVVVAHIVLVRKWRSGKPKDDKPVKEEIVTDLSRRNTIVPPVPPEQIENNIQNVDEDEYTGEEGEEESEEEIIIDPVLSKKSYQELQSTYSHILPTESSTKSKLESSPMSPKKSSYFHQPADDEEEEEEEEEEDDNEEIDEEEVEEGEDEAAEKDESDEAENYDEEEEGEDDEVGDENVEEDISDVDDDELLKKLEARYGKLPATRGNNFDEDDEEKENDSEISSWKRTRVLPDEDEESDDDPWTKESTVSATLQQKLKLAEANLRNNPELAYKLFTNLMEQLLNNNRVKYGHAQALDQLAELKRDNQLLQDAISSYYNILQSSTISEKLYLKVAERCIDRIRFRGHYSRAIQVHKEIINRFPNNPSHRNQLAVTLLTANRLAEAKSILEEILAKWPKDGFALAHYGFILKTKDNNMRKAVEYLKQGIKSRVPGVIDGRFYFHLGDALQRLGRNDEAMIVYEDGVKHNVFLSKYQRSLYNVNRLTGRPWWPLDQTSYASFFKLLENNWNIIREEGLALLNKAGYFKDEAENLRDTGQWKQFELFARGQKFVENCKKCPQTCTLIENFPDAKGCRRGQVKFSVMHPGTHVWPHCGPSNCRLRAHLGLKVPSSTFIRVADETRSWSEGKVFIFDDSFEHEVWHNGSDVRLVLIVDVWHPELTAYEKRSLPAI